jgi:hypothetical protein
MRRGDLQARSAGLPPPRRGKRPPAIPIPATALGVAKRRNPTLTATAVGLQQVTGDPSMVLNTPLQIPAQLSASGVYRPRTGIRRDVTGVHLPRFSGPAGARGEEGAEKAPPEAVWFAAISGRPRGPFTDADLTILAQRGKVRRSTLIWRPDFSNWTSVRRAVKKSPTQLGWLDETLNKRKRLERHSAQRADSLMQIQPLALEGALKLDRLPNSIARDINTELRKPTLMPPAEVLENVAAQKARGTRAIGGLRRWMLVAWILACAAVGVVAAAVVNHEVVLAVLARIPEFLKGPLP